MFDTDPRMTKAMLGAYERRQLYQPEKYWSPESRRLTLSFRRVEPRARVFFHEERQAWQLWVQSVDGQDLWRLNREYPKGVKPGPSQLLDFLAVHPTGMSEREFDSMVDRREERSERLQALQRETLAEALSEGVVRRMRDMNQQPYSRQVRGFGSGRRSLILQ